MIRIILAVAQILLTLFATFSLHATAQQAYPGKPVRFLVGYAPGGVNDIVSRLLALGTNETRERLAALGAESNWNLAQGIGGLSAR